MKLKNALQIIFIFFLISTTINTYAQLVSGNSYFEGTIKTEQTDILIWLCIENENTDSVKTYIDVPEQGAFNIKIDSINIDENILFFKIKSLATSFSGSFSDDKKTVTGIWNQSNREFDLVLTSVKNKPKVNRPQEPHEPFSYESKEVFFENKSAKIKLAGTLTLPENSWKAPAVILVTGSGPQNRNSELLGHKSFLVLADYFTRNGIAVLRYDERGQGKSEGKFASATTLDFAEDAKSAYQYLKNNKAIDSKKIGIIGHSEGGIVAAILASQLKDLAFIVSLAGPGTSGEQILYQQTELIMLAKGDSKRQIKKDIRFISKIYAIAKSDASYKQAVLKIRKVYKRKSRFKTKNQSKAANLSKTNRELTIRQVLTPWFRKFLVLDPSEYLQKTHCPALVLIGSKDLQVPANPNLMEIEKALNKAGNKNFEIKEIENLNHLFQNCDTGSPTEYFKIEETFSEDVMKLIAKWIHTNTK